MYVNKINKIKQNKTMTEQIKTKTKTNFFLFAIRYFVILILFIYFCHAIFITEV